MRFIRVFGMLAVAACASVPAPPPSPSPERATVDAVLHSPEFGSLLHNLPDSTWLSSEFHRPGEVIPLAETTLHVQSDPGQWEPPPGAASIRRVVVVQAWADSAIVGIESSGWSYSRARRQRLLFIAGQSWVFRRRPDGTWPFELFGQWAS